MPRHTRTDTDTDTNTHTQTHTQNVSFEFVDGVVICKTKFLHNYLPLNYICILHFRPLNVIANMRPSTIYKTKIVYKKI